MRVEFSEDERRGRVFAGVDTHSATHWLCVLSEYGSVRLSEEFPATPEGYDALAAAIGAPDGCVAVGVEGTASYGAGLTRRLGELGYRVYEVLRPKRAKRRRGQSKNDALDAERAARDAMSGAGLSIPKSQDGWVERLRRLQSARDCLVNSCTRLSNTALCLVVSAPDGERAAWSGMGTERLMRALSESEGASRDLASLGRAWVQAKGEAASIESEMGELVAANCPALLAMYGCSVVSASRILVAVGDNPERVGSESQLAALFGTSPVEASSGETARHRINRGGNRDANSALYQVVLSRMRHDPRTQAYVARRCGAGAGAGRKSKKEAIRCLQRYVVREVYHAITHPFDVPEEIDPAELRAARRAAGLRLRQVADALGVSISAVSLLERGKEEMRSLRRRYAEWVAAGMPVGAPQRE